MAIQTPPGWIADQVSRASHALGTDSAEHYWHRSRADRAIPFIQRIRTTDVWDALRLGARDFGASRSDVMTMCLVYPIVGLLLGRFFSDQSLLPLLFPLISGFALIGPFAAIGLMEMSRQREEQEDVGWIHAFHVLRSPSLGAIVLLGLFLLGLFACWLGVANLIYIATLGPDDPLSVSAFAHDTFTTSAGWTMIVMGIGVGFLFAALVLATSIVSFPLLLDRKRGAGDAIVISLRAVARNPGPATLWGMIVVVGLVIGALPLLLGLIMVMPILGHASWHLYRKLIRWQEPPI